MNRLKISAYDFYLLSPAELYYAFEDFEETHFAPSKQICEAIRLHGQIVFNNAFGRKKHDVIIDPKKVMTFPWDEPKKAVVQSLEAMKSTAKAIASVFNSGKRKGKKTIQTIRTRRGIKRDAN